MSDFAMSNAAKANGIQLRCELVAPPQFCSFSMYNTHHMLSKEECQGVRLPYLDDDRAHADCRYGSMVKVQKRDCVHSIS